MNRIKKHILGFFSILLSLVIILTTSGFSIYVHHCNHNHASYYSLFVPSHKCNMHAPKPVVKSCCQTKESKKDGICDEAENGNGCCTNQTEIVKLDTKLLLDNSIPTIKPVESPSFIMAMVFNLVDFTDTRYFTSTHRWAESPPPLTTAEYLSRIQVFII